VKNSHQGLRAGEDVVPYRAPIVWFRPWFKKKEIFKIVKKPHFTDYGELL